MEKRSVISLSIVFAILIVSSVSVSALTASIGNSRMILRVDVGDTIDRSILVRNTNDYTVNVNITVSGDLANDIVLEENSFVLEPGEEKDAGFKIEIDEVGRTESQINVAFSAVEENGVGLSATVIVVASDGTEEETEEDIEKDEDNAEDEEKEPDNSDSGGSESSGSDNSNEEVSSGSGGAQASEFKELSENVNTAENVKEESMEAENINSVSSENKGSEKGAVMLSVIVTFVLVFALILVYFYSLSSKSKVPKRVEGGK